MKASAYILFLNLLLAPFFVQSAQAKGVSDAELETGGCIRTTVSQAQTNVRPARAAAEAGATAAAASTGSAELGAGGQASLSSAQAQSTAASLSADECLVEIKKAREEINSCLSAYNAPSGSAHVTSLYNQANNTLNLEEENCENLKTGSILTANNLMMATLAVGAVAGIASLANGGDKGSKGGGGGSSGGGQNLSPGATGANKNLDLNNVDSKKSIKDLNLGDPTSLQSAVADSESTGSSASNITAPNIDEIESMASDSSGDGAAMVAALNANSESFEQAAEAGGRGLAGSDYDYRSKRNKKDGAAANEDAGDFGYLGKNKKQKSKKSLAEEIAEKKRLAKQQRDIAAAKAREQSKTDFVVTPKSCAERNWQGAGCQAIKSDPLLNVK